MRIVLFGLPAVGKTTLGKKVAEKLSFSFIDTDALFDEPLPTAFKRLGERKFREKEHALLCSIQETPALIAVGGGTLTDLANQRAAKKLGKLVLLKADPALLFERLERRGLPVVVDHDNPKESFHRLAQERMKTYEPLAEVTLDATSPTLVEEVCALYGE